MGNPLFKGFGLF